jgi:SAM-dependent methyltransferase
MALNIPQIISATISEATRLLSENKPSEPVKHLDIGPGHGDLIKLLREEGTFISTACDYTDELMALEGVKVDIVDLNTQKLPYEDSSFDLVTCTEVIEHIEHYRETLREMHRVLRPGGVLVVTTPNILNIKSRLRFLFVGFYNLFGPLHMRESRIYSTGGHINPVSYFYLCHSLMDSGFARVDLTVDKYQRGSIFFFLLLFPILKVSSFFSIRKERSKRGTIDDSNLSYVQKMNSMDILLGRTIVVSCRK